MYAAADPYLNIHKKPPQTTRRLVPILEARAADPQREDGDVPLPLDLDSQATLPLAPRRSISPLSYKDRTSIHQKQNTQIPRF